MLARPSFVALLFLVGGLAGRGRAAEAPNEWQRTLDAARGKERLFLRLLPNGHAVPRTKAPRLCESVAAGC